MEQPEKKVKTEATITESTMTSLENWIYDNDVAIEHENAVIIQKLVEEGIDPTIIFTNCYVEEMLSVPIPVYPIDLSLHLAKRFVALKTLDLEYSPVYDEFRHTFNLDQFSPDYKNELGFLIAIADNDIAAMKMLSDTVNLNEMNNTYCLISFTFAFPSETIKEENVIEEKDLIRKDGEESLHWKLSNDEYQMLIDSQYDAIPEIYAVPARSIYTLHKIMEKNGISLDINCIADLVEPDTIYKGKVKEHGLRGRTMLAYSLIQNSISFVPVIRVLLMLGARVPKIALLKKISNPSQYVIDIVEGSRRKMCAKDEFWDPEETSCVTCENASDVLLKKIAQTLGIDPDLPRSTICEKVREKKKRFLLPKQKYEKKHRRTEYCGKPDTVFAHLYILSNVGRKHTCVLFGKMQDEFPASLRVDIDTKQNVKLTSVFDVISELKKCEKRLTVMYLRLVREKGPNKTNEGRHANVLIFDRESNIVERFEPHGFKEGYTFSNPKIDQTLKDYFANAGINYLAPMDWCPTGFQSMQATEMFKGDVSNLPYGFCVAWSMWYAFLRVLLPALSRDEIIFFALEELKKRPGTLTEYIIDYAKFYENAKEWLRGKTPKEQCEMFHTFLIE